MLSANILFPLETKEYFRVYLHFLPAHLFLRITLSLSHACFINLLLDNAYRVSDAKEHQQEHTADYPYQSSLQKIIYQHSHNSHEIYIAYYHLGGFFQQNTKISHS